MANATDTAPKAYFAQEKSIISRLIEDHANPGTMMTAMHNALSVAESKARSYFDTKANHALSPGGVEVLRVQSLNDAESKLAAIVDAEVKPAADHLRQVEDDLTTVPGIHVEIAREIRDELRKMTPSGRAAKLRTADDDEAVSAIVHGPRGMFALVDAGTMTTMLNRYNQRNRPQQFALAQELRDRIDAVQNFRDMLLRRLKETLR